LLNRVTWGIDPSNPQFFAKIPLTEVLAIQDGWTKDKDCSQMNGIRYIKQNDRSVMVIFGKDGLVAGISTAFPKNLPFNFPSNSIKPYLVDEGSFYSITAYFKEPNGVCMNKRQNTGDRLLVKGSLAEFNIPLTEIEISIENKWTKGKCFNTMGQHYWRQVNGNTLTINTNKDDFFPMFLLFNKGKLNGFGFVLNVFLDSPRFEHPTVDVLNLFLNPVPLFFSDLNQSNGLSTLHVYFESTPFANFC
jgi:hypothetical protein